MASFLSKGVSGSTGLGGRGIDSASMVEEASAMAAANGEVESSMIRLETKST